MENYIIKIEETTGYLIKEGFIGADTAIVLGTGLGNFTEKLLIEKTCAYHTIPNFPLSTVEFHKGQLILAVVEDRKIIVMQGRFHYYEGYSMQQITFPIRVLKGLGVKNIFLTNAAGGINKDLRKGDLVNIIDHINLLPDNPLRGLNDPRMGNRFVDMCKPYSLPLQNALKTYAVSLGINLKDGIYASVMGPNLETRAEYRYLERIGADMVGMSTVPEVIVANHIGMGCAAISVITDECDPENLKPVNIEEIIAVSGKADAILSLLLKNVISHI